MQPTFGWLVGWLEFSGTSAQIGYIVPLKIKKVKLVRKLTMLLVGIHTINIYNN